MLFCCRHFEREAGGVSPLSPFLQLCPVQPEGQEQRPVTASQRALFSQMHFMWQPWPNRPLGHAGSRRIVKEADTQSAQGFSVFYFANFQEETKKNALFKVKPDKNVFVLTVSTDSTHESRSTYARSIVFVTHTSVLTRWAGFCAGQTPESLWAYWGLEKYTFYFT